MYDFTAAPAKGIFNLNDVLEVLSPMVHHVSGNDEIKGFSLDSRELEPGQVYVAVKGERVDGHRYVDDVLAKGAAACLVSSFENVVNSDRCIVVDDPVNALGYLAACHRRAMNAGVIGLTGSVGKTTTKDVLHTLLRGSFTTRKSEGNRNSTLGLPIEILKLRPEDEWMVAEMGMSTPGEIAKLTRMADPDIGLWIAVKAVHQANFTDLDGIARAKAELMDHMRHDSHLVYNRDDAMVSRYAAHFQGPKTPYGLVHPDAEISARIVPMADWHGTHFFLNRRGKEPIRLFLPVCGRFNVYNVLAACATALRAGLDPAELVYGLRGIELSKGRCRLDQLENDILVVDDTYNANPAAVTEVIRGFASLAPHRYRWIILGDMLELGPHEAEIHYRLGQTLARQGFDRITLVGPLSINTRRGCRDANPSGIHLEHFNTADQALSHMDCRAPAGARIWAKASRGIRLENLVAGLMSRLIAA